MIARFAALGLVFALAAPANAAHCSAPYAEETLLDAGGLYVTSDCDAPCVSIWIYEESNGVPGLQRDEGSCHGMIEGDTIVF